MRERPLLPSLQFRSPKVLLSSQQLPQENEKKTVFSMGIPAVPQNSELCRKPGTFVLTPKTQKQL
jgi:hypothetical protein